MLVNAQLEAAPQRAAGRGITSSVIASFTPTLYKEMMAGGQHGYILEDDSASAS
jgi:hypothetical protein